MLYFRHETSGLQVVGIVVVFASTMVEFLSEILRSDNSNK